MPGGKLRLAMFLPGDPGGLLKGPPAGLVEWCMFPADTGLFPGRPGLKPCTAGGAPCRDSENAFILACISDVRPLALVAGIGRRAAFTGPSGAEDALMVGAEESLGFRNEGGLGDSSGEPENWGCTSSVPFVVFGDEVFAVGSSMMYGSRGVATEARGIRSMLASRERQLGTDVGVVNVRRRGMW
jgi:hypothetical protein